MPYASLLENPASRTLLIPLVIRARESARPDRLFEDSLARDIEARLPRAGLDFPMHPFMRTGTAVRVRYFDDLAESFLAEAERPVVVHLGCGLDTRFSRTDKGKGMHVHIDLPEVMALRGRVLPESRDRCADWPGSITDRDWMDRLEREFAGRRFLFMAEGVLMYLREEDVRMLLGNLADRFPGSRLAFDTVGRAVFRKINRQSAVRQLDASLSWGYDDDGSLDAWHPRLQRLDRAYYFNRFRRRWGVWSLMHYYPPVGRGSVMHSFGILD